MLRKILLLSLIVIASACTTSKKESNNNILQEQSNKFGKLENDLLKKKTLIIEPKTFEAIPNDKNGARVDDRVFFDLNSAILNTKSQAVLDRQIAWLERNPKSRIIIEGHTDERGTREYNLALGDRRSNAVKSYLTSSGVERNRIITVSYGKERPIEYNSNTTSLAAMNRRAVTKIRD